MVWGIGMYLYDLDSPWVLLDTYQGADGKTYVKGIQTNEMAKLRASLNAADPEARAIVWAHGNAKAIKAATRYPGAASILAEAGIQVDEIKEAYNDHVSQLKRDLPNPANRNDDR